MKKLTFLILITIGSYLQASNLLVKEYGVNNTYPTIQSAIDAAIAGDSIIVFDKPSGMNWQENITIDKVVHIVNADGLRQVLDGDIKVEPSPGDVHTFIGIDLLEGHKFYTDYIIDSLTQRCTINIIDCSAYQIDMDDQGLYVRVISSEIDHIYFKHGLMIDNDGEYFEISQEDYNQNDSVLIIGNLNYQGVINTNASVHIRNNILSNPYEPHSNYSQSCNHQHYGSIYHIVLDIQSVGSYNASYISNNSFALRSLSASHSNFCQSYYDYSEYIHARGLRINYTDSMFIYNNVFDLVGGNVSSETKTLYANGGLGTPFISHNYIESGLPQIEINVNNEYNNYDATLSIDEFGRCTGDCVDGGIYLGQYNDIDGTRNDAGTYGGSYSIDNYLQESTGKARVYYIDMTNFISTPNSISIKGGGTTVH